MQNVFRSPDFPTSLKQSVSFSGMLNREIRIRGRPVPKLQRILAAL
jgi:hypothetical protein